MLFYAMLAGMLWAAYTIVTWEFCGVRTERCRGFWKFYCFKGMEEEEDGEERNMFLGD